MWKRYATFILVALSMAASTQNAASARPSLKLELSVSATTVRVNLVNISHYPVPVNARFAFGSESYPVELNFEIRDSKGRILPFASHINTLPATQADWSVLNPGDLVGHDIPLSQIANEYGLRKSKYTMKVKYRSRPWSKGANIVLESEAVSFYSNIDAMKDFCAGTGPWGPPQTNLRPSYLLKFCAS